MVSSWTIHDWDCKLIASFVSLSVNLTNSQLESTSSLFADAFNIPIHNRSIYLSKLASLRSLLILAGCVLEYFSFLCYSKNENSRLYRFYVSLICLSLMFISRIIFLILQFFSSVLAYKIFFILAIEAFFNGFLHSIGALIPEHSAALVFGHHSCRIISPIFQLIVDFIVYSSLLSIKIQTSLNVCLSAFSVGLWTFYVKSINNHSYNSNGSNKTNNNFKNGENVKFNHNSSGRRLGFSETFRGAISPFLMLPMGSMFKDFLFPRVLPYALLKKNVCLLIQLLGPTADLIGSSFFLGLESYDFFYMWNSCFDGFWILIVPMPIILIFSMLAIHTRVSLAKHLINSKKWVYLTTICVVVGNGFLDPLSFGGVSKVVKPDLIGILRSSYYRISYNEGDFNVITYHAIFGMILRFIFKKLSVGYTDTRVSLGYIFPKFRPAHRMSKSTLGWYIFKNTFKRAWKDTGNDFKMDLKSYI